MRQRVKPGITGLAQINLSYDSCLDDVRAKVRYDLEYLRRQSLVEDLLIMAEDGPDDGAQDSRLVSRALRERRLG